MYPSVALSLQKKKKKKILCRLRSGIISGAVQFTSSLREIKIFVSEFI